jgi:hypothetical protein
MADNLTVLRMWTASGGGGRRNGYSERFRPYRRIHARMVPDDVMSICRLGVMCV